MEVNLKKKYRASDLIMYFFIFVCAAATLLALIWILSYILINGIPHLSWSFLTNDAVGPNPGILPMIYSTLLVVGVSIAIAAPVGIFAAIYLNEYAKDNLLRKIVEFATETLAGIPSIVYGLFGFIFFVTMLKMKLTLMSGSLTVSIMVLPTIIRTTEEALKSVPISYKEGSPALGASKLWTIFRIVIPCAIPGILTAIILSIGRIVGESAAIIYTAGTAVVALKKVGLFNTSRTLTVQMYQVVNEGGSNALNQAFAVAAVLIILVVILNFLANRFGTGLRKKATGK